MMQLCLVLYSPTAEMKTGKAGKKDKVIVLSRVIRQLDQFGKFVLAPGNDRKEKDQSKKKWPKQNFAQTEKPIDVVQSITWLG